MEIHGNIIYKKSSSYNSVAMKTEESDTEVEEEVKVPMPKFLKEFHPKFISPEWDEFCKIPIEDLFDEVHEHIKTDETKEQYIL
jgi:hypothetical protein